MSWPQTVSPPPGQTDPGTAPFCTRRTAPSRRQRGASSRRFLPGRGFHSRPATGNPPRHPAARLAHWASPPPDRRRGYTRGHRRSARPPGSGGPARRTGRRAISDNQKQLPFISPLEIILTERYEFFYYKLDFFATPACFSRKLHKTARHGKTSKGWCSL